MIYIKNHEAISDMKSYKRLTRLITENGADGTNVSIKPNRDVPSDSLQNPFVPDAGYCGYKGKGFQIQVMETYSPDKDQPDLITHVMVESAHKSVANALLPAIEDARKRDLAPTEVLADTTCDSDENIEKAKAQGVEVVAPATGPREEAITLVDFQFSATDEITACPAGQAPQSRTLQRLPATTARSN